ncbi:MAG TPA: response regulator [Cytophagales bacterium]|nr:response regulator [Cytophagales bacterium]
MFTAPNILVIDDDEVSNLITLNVLKDLVDESKIKFFNSGISALNFIENGGKIFTPPELILLDIDMPLLDGFEFIEKIRESPYSHLQNVPIVILSNSDHPYDIINSRKAGIKDYLLKPLNKAKIQSLMEKYGLLKEV